MELIYHGHACFELSSDEGSIVFDPYEKGYIPGIELPELSADAVMCSHGHRDHNAAHRISLTGRTPQLRITRIRSYHDENEGADRGENFITVVDTEGKRVVHCGDLGHLPDAETIEKLGRVDVLMIPVGGVYTVGPEKAKQTAEAIGAALTVPMHYRVGEAGLQNIAELSEFLSLFPENKREIQPGNRISIDSVTGRKILALTMPVLNI